MLPQYTRIQDGDVEKQPLVNDYQHGHPCHCGRQQQEQGRRSRPSKSTIAIFVLVLLLFVGYGRNICQKNHDHYSHSVESINIQQDSSPASANSLKWCLRRPLGVDWDGKSVYEFGQEITSLSVEHTDEGHISTKAGKVVVVENKKLEKSKVTFDIKLSNEHAQDAVRIDEVWTDHALVLNVVTNGFGYGGDCIKVDVLIEVPSSTVLDDLSLKFINNDITFKDKLELKDYLDVSAISGDVIFKKPIASSRKISLRVTSGDIIGVFDVDQVDFDSASVSGDMDLVFDRIGNDSTVDTSATSGNVKIQVPTDFESKFAINVVSGNVDLGAKDAKKLHYHRSGGIIGHKVNGYYGENESPSSKITLDVVSGNVKLNYH